MNFSSHVTTSTSVALPKLTRQQVDACAFASWFPIFKRISPKATIIPLDQAFIEYLRADGVFLPNNEESDSDSSLDPNGEEEADDEEEDISRPDYDFSALSERIQEVIDEYDSVFPKLNWSSPQDAAWMCAGPPLKCVNAQDIYLLLKSSDFVTHDLDHAYDDCEARSSEDESAIEPTKFHLVLKKWFSMPRSHEFRCFVRQKSLIAIAQRDTNFYDFLQDSQRQSDFTQTICRFFQDKIRNTFSLDDYVFDIYLTRDESKVFLIDFNPYGLRTDALLFTWDEIHSLPVLEWPLLRVVESEAQASQSMPAFSHNRYPKDVVGLSDGTSIADFAQKWREALTEAVADTTAGSGGEQADSEIPGR